MVENNKYREICSTCKNASGCTFPRNSQKPVLYCEEFEVDICPSVKIAGKEKLSPTAPVDAKEDSGKFIGLCSNCDNRRTCVFPKPEGGIWHCEEYR